MTGSTEAGAAVRARVLDRLLIDGTEYGAGAEVLLPAAEFAKLAALGVVGPWGAPEPEAEKEPPPADPDAAVKAAIARLEPSDFDADGLPRLAAVKARLPEGSGPLSKARLVTIWGDLKLTP
ncbi:MAG: hypothetical protein INF92_07625 [Rhodobacter sp.]|nr:hypothetical protein [Rhodobacter sp.]